MPALCSILFATIGLLIFTPSAEAADKPGVADLLGRIQAAGPEGKGAAEARAAWDELVKHGPDTLPAILGAMDASNNVAFNWLKTAFDAIAERDLKSSGKAIPTEALLTFVQDAKRPGRARRLALELVEKVTPGTTRRLVAGWLDDPEFRYDAVAAHMEETLKISALPTVQSRYLTAFRAARDVEQVKAVARKLKDFGVEVDVLDHLGFFKDWYVLGPFDAKMMQGFKAVYPPEEKIDLAAEYAGKAGKIKWKRIAYTHHERVGMISFAKEIGVTEDAVGYAYTAFESPEEADVEFRGGADDNLTLFVNGKKVFAYEEYRNGVRLDRHRVKVKLQKGVNTVLVKVCQAPLDATSPEPNWEFMVRMVDVTGKGLGLKSALPK